jgi:transmembrane sensor
VNNMNPDDDTMTIPSAQQQAHEWMVLLSADEACDHDRARFKRWLAIDTEHQQAWQETLKIWRQAEQLTHLGKIHQPRKNTAFANPSKKLTQWVSGFAVAASVLLAIALWLPSSPDQQQGVRYHSELAQTRQIHLPEGSLVTLGADSQIELRLSERQRRVILLRGEAFFEVTKDVRRPFIVDSQGTQVSVLGTRFNVNQLDRQSKVSVQSGLVAVTHLSSQKQVELAPGERVVSHLDGLAPVSRQDANKSGAWREGLRLYFDTPLNDVVADFNRYSKRPLELASAEMGKLSLTAVFPTDNIDKMVQSLSNVLPITITEEDQRILLSLRQ